MQHISPFHLAVPVHDLAAARAFYGELLGFEEGRSSEQWIDYNFYGHQFVVHLKPGMLDGAEVASGINDEWNGMLDARLMRASP